MPLKLDIKNFGPITSGSFELKPLTIFIGPNNAGKSYAAMLTHGVYNLINERPLLTSGQNLLKNVFKTDSADLVITLVEQSNEILVGNREHFSQELTQNVLRELIVFQYDEYLGDEISRLFSSPIRDLRRMDTRSSSLNLSLGTHNVSLSLLNKGIELKSLCQPSIDKDLAALTKNLPASYSAGENALRLQFTGENSLQLQWFLINLMGSWQREVSSEIFPTMNRSQLLISLSRYLPAARSGIIQVYKEVAAGFIDRAPFAGLEKRPDIPRLSGVVSDFISSLLRLKKEPGPLYELTKDFEQRLLRGSIVTSGNDLPFPEIQYKYKGTTIPLHRASSTVSELAPLFLYTKYEVEPGSLLIIEEPEAHLHPQNQRILAEFLVKLVRRGVHLLLTTHSEYLLEQFSNFIQLSRVKPRKRRTKFPYEKDVYLEADEVAAYAFRPDPNPRGTGHKIYPIEIDEDGISQENFTQVYDSLYEEGLRLQREVGNGQAG